MFLLLVISQHKNQKSPNISKLPAKPIITGESERGVDGIPRSAANGSNDDVRNQNNYQIPIYKISLQDHKLLMMLIGAILNQISNQYYIFLANIRSNSLNFKYIQFLIYHVCLLDQRKQRLLLLPLHFQYRNYSYQYITSHVPYQYNQKQLEIKQSSVIFMSDNIQISEHATIIILDHF
ncbi:Hypothetical_protein [Hexamita inflata]|uniref:Hypothetical_protein n=1 Tax=Hexamita inflata TaxID=28002 RepID=A0AA86P2V3_9EUKA|nr:Hypothetical protein HINF_LOCUS17034 [Hexamita inflata]CAI9929394.1 Hypothetical protein HINF_LOCUS17039 [Hexamita inflata]